jgi:predicted nucleotide-binding protein
MDEHATDYLQVALPCSRGTGGPDMNATAELARQSILLALALHDRAGSSALPSDKQLASMLELEPGVVRRHLDILESRGQVELTKAMGPSYSAMITGEGAAAIEAEADAAETVEIQARELSELLRGFGEDEDINAGSERLHRWKRRAVQVLAQSVNAAEAKRLEEMEKGSYVVGEDLRNLIEEAEMYRGFLVALGEEILKHPSATLRPQATQSVPAVAVKAPPLSSKTTFIVHGHDELNTLRLQALLREHWGLHAIVLRNEPGKGRTLIEKFEEEAQRASYGFVLLTPDDIVSTGNDTYLQARPNVIFELGWFYGRLGRARTCILYKQGTRIHSDLDGINRVEFNDRVAEKVGEIAIELKAAGLL